MASPDDLPREDGKGGLEAALGGASSQFRRRLGAGALVVLTLVVGVSTLLAWRQYDSEKKQALVELKARVVLASNVFDTYFAGKLGVLNSIAASPPVVADGRGGDAHVLQAPRERQGEAVHGRAGLDRPHRGQPRLEHSP